MEDKDLKQKTIRLATTISYHDLENKKRQAQGFFKTHQILRFYMKVNVYDQENIQKGRMMLLNIAEDLKEDCKMTVSPIKEEGKKKDQVSDDKPQDFDEMKRAAEAQKEQMDNFVGLEAEDVSDDEEDFESKAQYLYMELKSTASFKDVDIDSMLEHTTFDDFMRGLYLNKVQSTSKSSAASDANPFDQMMR